MQNLEKTLKSEDLSDIKFKFMVQIVFLIFIFSSLGILAFLFQKKELWQNLVLKKREKFFLKEKIKNLLSFPNFCFHKILYKILSKIKILALRAEIKTEKYLQKLREKSEKEKSFENFWQNLKNKKPG